MMAPLGLPHARWLTGVDVPAASCVAALGAQIPSRPLSWGRMGTRSVAIVAAFAALLVCIGCAPTTTTGIPKLVGPDGRALTTTTTSAADAAEADAAALQGGAPTIADLPSGWTLLKDGRIADATLQIPPSGPTCVPERAAGQRSAGRSTELAFHRAVGGSEEGHIVITALVQSTADDAKVTTARITDARYVKCGSETLLEDLACTCQSTPRVASREPLTFPPLYQGVATRTTALYTEAGAVKTAYLDAYDVMVGRVELRFEWSSFGTPFTQVDEAGTISRVAGRYALTRLSH